MESSSLGDARRAAELDAHPLYWVGVRFEEWELTTVDFDAPGFVTFGYGTCTPTGDEGGCAPRSRSSLAALLAA